MKRIYIIAAFLCVGLGAVGAVLPVLPTVPFLLAASFFFAKGSQRYHTWFVSTRLYHKYLKDYSECRAMTLRTKLTILLPVSALLVATMILVGNPYMTGCLILVLVAKYAYFIFGIQTISKQGNKSSHRREH